MPFTRLCISPESVTVLVWPGIRSSMSFNETSKNFKSFCTPVSRKGQDWSLDSGMAHQCDSEKKRRVLVIWSLYELEVVLNVKHLHSSNSISSFSRSIFIFFNYPKAPDASRTIKSTQTAYLEVKGRIEVIISQQLGGISWLSTVLTNTNWTTVYPFFVCQLLHHGEIIERKEWTRIAISLFVSNIPPVSSKLKRTNRTK